eukprot:scaffold10530_cov30-Tisochrysis_lutea.AAC.2
MALPRMRTSCGVPPHLSFHSDCEDRHRLAKRGEAVNSDVFGRTWRSGHARSRCDVRRGDQA